MTPQDQLATATHRRNAQIEAAPIADAVRKHLAQQPKLAALMQPLAAGDPTAADMLALETKLDIDNSGSLNANDFQAFGSGYASVTTWRATMKAPTNLAASVSGPNVTLTWTNNATDPAAGIQLYRNGVATGGLLAPGTTMTTDTPGNGSFTWTVEARRTGSAPSLMSNAVQATVGVVIPVAGWTDLTLAPGAVAVYVSSSSGNDANTGAIAAPMRTIAAGYAKLRDSTADQLLLKCGDTFDPIGWTKASGNAAHPMICASYGTGPRPVVLGGGFYLGQQNKSDLAFVDLDIHPATVGGASNGFVMFAPWKNVLFEGCNISGFNVCLAIQEVTADRLSNIKVRRCNISDSAGGGGHNQGLFVGSTDGLLVEECVFDQNGNYPGQEKADMFCHNVYLHQTNGPSTFINNITARACSHGVQQRSGGVMNGNLALDNPIGLFQGDASAVHNTFTFNGAVGSRNISAAELRGFGFWLNGSAGIDVLNNFAAHQHTGTANCEAFSFDGVAGAIVRNNIALDWTCPGNDPWGHGFTGSGIAVFENNKSIQPNGGQCIFDSTGGTRRNNTYWSTSTNCFNGGPWTAYQTNETGSVFAAPSAPLDVSIGTYLASLGMSGGVDIFMAKARANCKQNWDVRFTAKAFNDWARNRLGIANPIST